MNWGQDQKYFLCYSIHFCMYVYRYVCTIFPLCLWGWFLEPPLRMPESKDAEVPYVKWYSTIGPEYPCILHWLIQRANCILNLHLGISVHLCVYLT